MVQSRLLTDLKSLAGKSVIYGLGGIFLRGISFFLLPLYTRFLTPADYGIMAVTTTITVILGILYPLNLHGALTPFYFKTQDEVERRRNNGAIWIGMVAIAISIATLLDRLGDVLFSWFFPEVPFAPYIRLSIWTAFFNILGLLPLTLFQIKERASTYVFTSVANTLLTIGLVVYFVVLQQGGAYGYLLGTFLASIIMAIPYLVLTMYQMKFTLDWNILKAALVFSLPLVPHGLASWVLELSDRAILQHFVSLGELGLYAIGYQFGSVMNLFIAAFTNAWSPFLYNALEQHGATANEKLARLSTYYALILCFVASGLVLFVKYILVIFTASAFHSAYHVTPWVMGGYVFSGLYIIPVGFLFWKTETKLIPVVTVSSGLLNIGLNLWLVPYFGIMAAAWATFLSYVLMLVLVWRISLSVYSFPYEYKRLGKIGIITILIFILSSELTFSWITVELIVRLILWLAFPVILAIFGFFTNLEKEMFLSFVQQVWLRVSQEWSGRSLQV